MKTNMNQKYSTFTKRSLNFEGMHTIVHYKKKHSLRYTNTQVARNKNYYRLQ